MILRSFCYLIVNFQFFQLTKIKNTVQNLILLFITKKDHNFELRLITNKSKENQEKHNLDDNSVYIDILFYFQIILISFSTFLISMYVWTKIRKIRAHFAIHENAYSTWQKKLKKSLKIICYNQDFVICILYLLLSIMGLFNFLFIAIL